MKQPARAATEPAWWAVLLRGRQAGLTLRQAAEVAGVHVATVCRWQARDPQLRHTLRKARPVKPLQERPPVPWHRDCPRCRARVVVRKTTGGVPFWRCGCWPYCRWSSWRPRAPRNCKRCGAPCFWSHSRKSIGCSACGVRIKRL
jgi:hypothetical protein